MPWVSTKSCLFNGRRVRPGDPLPEVDSWGRIQRARRVAGGWIAFVEEPLSPGQAIETTPVAAPVVPAAEVQASPLPVPSIQSEPLSPGQAKRKAGRGQR